MRNALQFQVLSSVDTIETAVAELPKEKTAAEANAKLKAVLFGAKQTAAQGNGETTFGSTGADACGNSVGGSNSAGKLLANDIVCLCGGNGATPQRKHAFQRVEP